MSAQGTPAVRVVVADDHERYRDGIVRTLRAAGMVVVGAGRDGDEALALIREHRPDVALLDVVMPGMGGLEVAVALARDGPPIPVVMLSGFDEERLVAAAHEAGAIAFVSKRADREVIVSAVSAAATGSSP